jgi:hypothetical protein
MMTQASPGAPAGLPHRRLRLAAGTPAAADAVAAVLGAIGEWQVPVNRGLAAALTSDLVISAVASGASGPLMLVVRSTGRRLRVEVHDASVRGDSWETAAAGPESQRGLLLAAICAAGSGHFRTPAGRAVFYELEFPLPDAATGGGQARGGRGDGEP